MGKDPSSPEVGLFTAARRGRASQRACMAKMPCGLAMRRRDGRWLRRSLDGEGALAMLRLCGLNRPCGGHVGA